MSSSVSIAFKKFRKWALFFTPLRSIFLYKHEFMQSPRQLQTLLELFEETKDIHGDVVEVGVAYGHTTILLNRLMEEQGVEKKYIAIDTFSGFLPKDIQYERESRDKKKDNYSAFQVNAKAWFDKTMEINYINRVESYEMDAGEFQFSSPVSFCLLDVDIYLPTKKVLENIWPHISPGGIILIDDCKDNSNFDGSFQAYQEFIKEHSLPSEVRSGQGIIRKL
jgi:predicted O-methyltransferase YrrM